MTSRFSLALAAAFSLVLSLPAADPFMQKQDLFKVTGEGYKIYHIPGIVVTAKGTVLAWCEARKNGHDWDDIHVLLRRSTDDGLTWSEPKNIVNVEGPKTKNPFALAIKNVDPKTVTYNNPVMIADKDGTIHMLFCLEYMRAFYQRSTDDGLTWTQPVEITSTFESFRKVYDWKVLATGPNHSIQLQKTGRLVVPVWLSTGTGGNAHRPSVTSTIYSDDQGKTWLAGEIAVPNTEEWINPNETVAVELSDGSVMLNVRSESKAHRRLVTISKDGATGWSTPRFDDALLEPICMGGIVRYSSAATGQKNRLLFSNPSNLEGAREKGKPEPGKSRLRQNLSVKLSYNEGLTWAVNKVLEPGWSAYSDIAVTPKGTILSFYGASGEKHHFAGDRLTLARYNLEWLTDGKDTTPVASREDLPIMDPVTVNGLALPTKKVPQGLTLHPQMGLLTVSFIQGQLIHRTTSRILETRATITPNGDYLLMFPEGDHYAKSKGEKINTMMACRSTDKGKTWSAPQVAYDVPYGQHGFIPFIPRGSKRLYAFGTQPMHSHWTHEGGQHENAAIGYRWSDDDGHTWSDVKLIAPVNDPGFRGMSVMRMTETDAGTWLLGSHIADWSFKPIRTKQYILRSDDKGETWTVLPHARPDGWFAEGFDRMDEGRPLNLGGGRVLFMSRTPAGKLFTAWSKDDGKTWTEPAPSTLVHPDAPPMLFPLSDGKTLVAFHHNKLPPTNPRDLNDKAETMKVRSEVWVSTSTDEGHTWSEPRFVMANAVENNLAVGGFNFQCSYLDAFTEDGVMHIFMPHRWQQALHLTIKESDFASLPTKAQLAKFKGVKPAPKVTAAVIPPSAKPAPKKPEPNYASKLAADMEPTRRVIYKKIGDVELGLDIFEPAGFKKGDQRACFFSIHGGGWTSGSTRSMYPFTDYFAKKGMVGISVQYRLFKVGGPLTVFDCVKDARAALRYVRTHAAEFGIDPNKIIANGASAGGHLAAATALFPGVDHEDENLLISCRPDAMILFSPVIDTSSEGYGHAKIGDRWEELSPAHRVLRSLPPTLLFHGTGDTTTPIKGARVFDAAMRKAGNRIEFIAPEGAIHTYMFKDARLHAETLQQMDAFIATLNW
ncbi:exo-alpha-sialidase [Prosthecobacter fusiformis]|nr:exo-alpha-sialidase [Prosthecobacter fusiformis]